MVWTWCSDKIEESKIGPLEQIYERPTSQTSIPYKSRRNVAVPSRVDRLDEGQITSLHAQASAQDIDNQIPDHSGLDSFDDGVVALNSFDDIFIGDGFGALTSYRNTGGGNTNASKTKKNYDAWTDQHDIFAADQTLYYKGQLELLEMRRAAECRILQQQLDHIEAEGQCPTCGKRNCQTTAYRKLQVIGLEFAHDLRLAVLHCPM